MRAAELAAVKKALVPPLRSISPPELEGESDNRSMKSESISEKALSVRSIEESEGQNSSEGNEERPQLSRRKEIKEGRLPNAGVYARGVFTIEKLVRCKKSSGKKMPVMPAGADTAKVKRLSVAKKSSPTTESSPAPEKVAVKTERAGGEPEVLKN